MNLGAGLAPGAPLYLMRSTWANIISTLSGAQYAGLQAFATDIGPNGQPLIHDGSTWVPLILSWLQATRETATIIFSGFGCTYSQSGTTVTVTATSHGLTSLENGARIHLTQSTGTFVTETCTGFTWVDADTFTCTSATSRTTSGNLGANSSETFATTTWTAPSWRKAGVALAPTYRVHCKNNTNTKSIKSYYSGVQANATLSITTGAASNSYQTTSNTIQFMSASTFMVPNNNGGATGNGILNTEVNQNFTISATLGSGASAADWALIEPYFMTGNWRGA